MEFFNSAVDVLQTLVIALALALVSGASSICWRDTAMTILGLMLMCHKVTQKATDSRHNSVKIDTATIP